MMKYMYSTTVDDRCNMPCVCSPSSEKNEEKKKPKDKKYFCKGWFSAP